MADSGLGDSGNKETIAQVRGLPNVLNRSRRSPKYPEKPKAVFERAAEDFPNLSSGSQCPSRTPFRRVAFELLIRAFESRGKRCISAMKGMASPDIRQKVLILLLMIIIILWKKDCYFNSFTVVSDPESDFGHILDQEGGGELHVSEVVAGGG